MMSFGKNIRCSIYGESHGEMVGMLVDGIPSGTRIDMDFINAELKRRKSGKAGTTKRIESDIPFFLSGLKDGYATGAPMLIGFKNENTVSKDYSQFLETPRPSHADFVAHKKYNGFEDYRGGGHFSGRITLGLVATGAICKGLIPYKISSRFKQVGTCTDLSLLDDYLLEVSKKGDSVGAILEVTVSNMEIGLGEPFFDSLESVISHMMFSIPAIKGIEFGQGFSGVTQMGSQFNDCFISIEGKTKTNHNGGINGGISNGNDLVFRVFIKPTPSIFISQETFNFHKKQMDSLKIEGRHDACIALRAQVVVEDALAICLADLAIEAKKNAN